MGNNDENNGDGTGAGRFPKLNDRQEIMFESALDRFKEYLLTEGKNPLKQKGYAEDSIDSRVSRVLKAIYYIWKIDGITMEITPEQADRVINDLNTDDFRRLDGDRYAEGSKRKIANVLTNWFEFHGSDWQPKIKFKDGPPQNNADLFTKIEVNKIWNESLVYKSIPKYKNLTPKERDNWKGYLAQELGKPKEEVTPDDWKRVNTSWKFPSVISTERAAGWRPALINRMKVDWYNPDAMTITIPAEQAVKSDIKWIQKMNPKATDPLDRWIEQRENIEKYDDSDHMWLNRKGNPYNSKTLNDLLDNLMENAGINAGGRKLCWYSFRHTLGTHVYHEYKDLKIVAETLRQKSPKSALRYIHVLDDDLRDASDII